MAPPKFIPAKVNEILFNASTHLNFDKTAGIHYSKEQVQMLKHTLGMSDNNDLKWQCLAQLSKSLIHVIKLLIDNGCLSKQLPD